jgi:hypothetical protein
VSLGVAKWLKNAVLTSISARLIEAQAVAILTRMDGNDSFEQF